MYILNNTDDALPYIDEHKTLLKTMPVPTSEVRFVGEAPGTFIVWPTRLLQPIFRRPHVYCDDFS